MDIGIIGAGNIGGTLTRMLSKLGHHVCVSNSRGPDTLVGLSQETGAAAVRVGDAARWGEVVVVTIPLGQIPNLPRGLFANTPEATTVIDTCN